MENLTNLTELETELLTEIVESFTQEDEDKGRITDFILGENDEWARKLTSQEKGVLSSLIKKRLVCQPCYYSSGDGTAQVYATELGISLIRK
tara:strand:- start:1544 stop:1819 length:276 start_codon:yes stop_codon:yes gene_type:complete